MYLAILENYKNVSSVANTLVESIVLIFTNKFKYGYSKNFCVVKVVEAFRRSYVRLVVK